MNDTLTRKAALLVQYNSGRKWEGTFAEYVLIPARYVIRIPEELSLRDEVIAPILCGGVTAYKALKVSNVTPGKWIAVLGAAGGVGALAIQYARAMGYRVLAVDISSEKANFCRELGAEAYLDVAHTDDFPERVSEVTSGQDASCVLVIAGSSKAYELGLKILAPFGVLTCVGIPPANQLATFHPLLFIDKGIRIIGSAVGTRKDILEALSFVERGLVIPSITLTSLEGLTEITQFSGAVNGKYVVKF
ncbi:hypothetical protein Plec18167_007633 [Paecilomyces lecythidis]|uniref:Enoyl reductase (ER) domain-containing protein n=1 Tax=Paecilomyces lecythidis TaxID=3004212 RepID=A0ABR3X2N5_9EURO